SGGRNPRLGRAGGWVFGFFFSLLGASLRFREPGILRRGAGALFFFFEGRKGSHGAPEFFLVPPTHGGETADPLPLFTLCGFLLPLSSQPDPDTKIFGDRDRCRESSHDFAHVRVITLGWRSDQPLWSGAAAHHRPVDRGWRIHPVCDDRRTG